MLNYNGRQTVFIDGGEGKLTLGGSGCVGDIALINERGRQTLHLDGGEGHVTLGGNGHDGDIMMTTSSGTKRIELEPHEGNIRANDAKGNTTVELIGGSGEIRVKDKKLKGADHVFADDYRLAPAGRCRSLHRRQPQPARHCPGTGHAERRRRSHRDRHATPRKGRGTDPARH
jgi:hypothetical protein